MTSSHPRIVLVGARGTGKSTLVSRICGISLGTSTTCPVEWHLQPSELWSAEVTVSYFNSPFWSSKKFRTTSRRIVLDAVATPQELHHLVRRAELLAFSSGQEVPNILSMSDENVDREHTSILLSSAHSSGVVYVNLQGPGYVSRPVTLIDLPGFTQTGYTSTINHIQDLICHYVTGKERSIVSLLVDPGEQDLEKVPAFSYLKRRGKDVGLMTVIAGHTLAETPTIHPAFNGIESSRKPSYHWLHFLAPDQRAPAALSSEVMKKNRQDEAAYFALCKPWSIQPAKTNLGVPNILKEWASEWDALPIEEPRITQSISWSHIFIVVVLILVIPTLLG